MSFSKGLLQAAGFSAGMAWSNNAEVRPVIRKRRFTAVLYLLANTVMLFKCFSLQKETSQEHWFLAFLHSTMQRFPELHSYAEEILWKDMWYLFSLVMFCSALLVFMVIVLLRISPSRSAFDVGNGYLFLVTVLFSGVMYAVSYDTFYFLFGNRCAPYVGILCFNFANYAHQFALCATAVYVARSLFFLLPGEVGTIVFFGSLVKDIRQSDRNRLYFVPTAPVPHFVYMSCNYMFDLMPAFYDVYHVPDGRERAAALHHHEESRR